MVAAVVVGVVAGHPPTAVTGTTTGLAPALALVAETIPIRDAAVMVATNGVGNHPLLHRATWKSGVIRKQGERRGLGHHRLVDNAQSDFIG